MLYVDPGDVEIRLATDWNDTAKAKTSDVTPLDEDTRRKAINRIGLWRELRDTLGGISNDKCWYCETVQERSDMPVDHYRPKNSVYDDDTHPGYWWLAFSWENLRLSCTWCNSRRIGDESEGGKRDEFPLVGGVRARKPEDPLTAEEPALLDPCEPSDPPLLTFRIDGQPDADPWQAPDGSVARQRVAESIRILHLDEGRLVDARIRLRIEMKAAFAAAQRAQVRMDAGDGTARADYIDALHRLTTRVRRSAEYAAAARAILLSFRGESQELVDLVLRIA